MRDTPPFRADHVGSLLRPPELLQARADHAAGRIDGDALRRLEDDAIREAVRHAGGGRAPVGHGRRVPPRLVAHGLHLPAGRRSRRRPARSRSRSTTRRATSSSRPPRSTSTASSASRGRSSATTSASSATRSRRRPEADDPVAEHGALPRRAGPRSTRRSTRTWTSSGATSRPPTARRCGGSASSAARTSSSTTRASRT